MDRLNQLRLEYEDINQRLECPFDVGDYCQLKERRAAILDEAYALAVNLGFSLGNAESMEEFSIGSR